MKNTKDDPPRRPLIGAAQRRRALAKIARTMRALLIAMGRDHERCGKAACARSRRCHGVVCDRAIRLPRQRTTA